MRVALIRKEANPQKTKQNLLFWFGFRVCFDLLLPSRFPSSTIDHVLRLSVAWCVFPFCALRPATHPLHTVLLKPFIMRAKRPGFAYPPTHQANQHAAALSPARWFERLRQQQSNGRRWPATAQALYFLPCVTSVYAAHDRLVDARSVPVVRWSPGFDLSLRLAAWLGTPLTPSNLTTTTLPSSPFPLPSIDAQVARLLLCLRLCFSCCLGEERWT